MRYVVTGSAGFIGHHLCRALLESGVAVDGVDAFTDHYDPSLKRANAARLARYDSYRGVELDLATAELDDVLTGADAVIHLAAQPGVRPSWADGFPVYVERNVTASQRLLEAARRTRVPRLVLASSSSVYGNATDEPTAEDAPPAPPPGGPRPPRRSALTASPSWRWSTWRRPTPTTGGCRSSSCATSPCTARASARTWRCTGSSPRWRRMSRWPSTA